MISIHSTSLNSWLMSGGKWNLFLRSE